MAAATAPEPLLRFDLDELDSEGDLPRVHDEVRPVVRAGRLDGFCVYFRAIFDGEISLTTSPLEPPTSWGTRVFRAPGSEFEIGDKLAYRFEMTELARPATWSVTTVPTP